MKKETSPEASQAIGPDVVFCLPNLIQYKFRNFESLSLLVLDVHFVLYGPGSGLNLVMWICVYTPARFHPVLTSLQM